MRTSSLAVAVIADDLTGAADSSAPFADLAWQTTVWLDTASGGQPVRSPDAPVLAAAVTDSRSLDAPSARLATATAARLMRDAGFDRLFVKIDSTVRGPIAAQVAGALDVWREAHPDAVAVVCPAYPSMGRTVVGGRLLVHGLAAELSAAGRDPITPVATGDLLGLLPSARLVAVDDGFLASAHALRGADADTAIVDARDDDDLDHIAVAIARLGSRAIAVGSAGLSSALAHAWSSVDGRPVEKSPARAAARRVLVVTSSLHEVARRQCAALAAGPGGHSVRLLQPPPDAIRDVPDARSWAISELSGTSPDVVVVATPAQPVPRLCPEEAGSGSVLTWLEGVVDALLDVVPPDALVLIGGDGARSLLGHLGSTAIELTGSLGDGAALGRIVGGRLPGCLVVTKAGGLGPDGLITDVVDALLSGTHEGAET